MKILIYIFNGVTALDAVGPYESLSRIPEAEILFVSKERGEIRTGDGFLGLVADVSTEETPSADILILPGGKAESLRKEIGDGELHQWIQSIDQSSQFTCAVCTGSLILAAAGPVKGRRISTHWNARDHASRFGATYSGERITRDGKYITSAGVSAGIDMGLLLCEHVAGREIAEAIELSMEYVPSPPFGTGDFNTATEARIKTVREKLRI